jgi:RNA polymerase sigma-70 factor (ECF subfamily)
MHDNDIVNLFFSRDESAIFETQKKYAGYLFTVASNILGEQDAEECVNDTYFKAWEAIPPKRPIFFKGFLAKITRNCSLDKYRINNAKKRAGGQVDLLLGELSEIIPSRTDVHTTYENNLTANEINIFLRDLEKESRIIFMRRYFYADSIAQIAKNHGASESKIKSSLLRTRRKLKKHLES